MNNNILQRMKSIRQTVQISNAQKLVAAAHIGRARTLLKQSRPYHDKVSRVIVEVLRHCPGIDSRYIEANLDGASAGKGRGLLVLAASHGLAGGFNSNITHFAEQSLKDRPAEYIIVLGGACRARLIQGGYPVDPEYYQPLEPPTMFTARELAERVLTVLEWANIGSFDVIYTTYRSAARMETVQRRLLPLSPTIFEGLGEDRSNFDFEPSPKHVLESLLIKYLKGYIYGCLTNTYICELTSRVTAMDNAIRNGNEMLDKLSLAYNRARQSAITQEITEIIAGAAALQTE